MVYVGFFAAIGVILWSATVVVICGKGGVIARYSYMVLTAILAATALWTTYGYDAYWNEHTRAFGWPVPYLILQRDDPSDPNSPWLDFVGWTMIFALPMNFIIFMFIPSLLFLAAPYLRSWFLRTRPG